jgi:hypothetical protein
LNQLEDAIFQIEDERIKANFISSPEAINLNLLTVPAQVELAKSIFISNFRLNLKNLIYIVNIGAIFQFFKKFQTSSKFLF